MKKRITEKTLAQYEEFLRGEEKSRATIKKYIRDLRKMMEYAGG